MKKFLLFLIVAGMTMSAFAQKPAFMHKRMDQKAPYVKTNIADQAPGVKPANLYVANKSVLDDPSLMVTKYDLQSNSSSGQQRIYLWPDGTINAGATWSLQDATYSDRGTGYNFFDGTAWGAQPAARQESIRTGWPSLQPWGANGECLLAHQSATTPLIFATRPTKGTGAWTESYLSIPAPAVGMLWPRMVTNGPDHMSIHIIALTSPVANGGVAYNGMDGALLYIRSLDGGATWGAWQQLDGMTSSEYINFSADIYSWAQPMGDIIAFTVGDSWQDQLLMKSMDNGTTWTRTVIWPCPYNFWAGGDSVARYYCPDGTMAVALDMDGKAHVTFGLQQGSGDVAGGKYWVPYTDGLIYWNEYMPTFPAVLDPQTLYDNGNYIGWVLDTMIFYPPTGVKLAHYYCSMTSNPGITIDADNNIFVIWSGVTPLLDPDNFYLRHIYERTAKKYPDNNVMWQDSLTDITSDFLQYNWTECAYPDIAQNSDDNIYVLFMADDLAGSYVKGVNISGYSGQTSVTENNMIAIKRAKTDLYVGTGEKKEAKPSFAVSKNYPNPVVGKTTVNVNIQKPGGLLLEVTNLMGQKLMSVEKGNVSAGTYRFDIDGSQLASGIYFYTVKYNNESITNKMVVE
jgi:hypothetical protein